MAHTIEQVPGRYLPVAVEAKRDQEGNPRTNRDGVSQWSVLTLHTPVQGKPEVISITVPNPEKPDLTPMQAVVFDNLRVDHFAIQGGTSGLWFAADDVRPSAGSKKD